MNKIKEKKVFTSVVILSLVFLLLAGLFVPVYAQESSLGSESIIQENSSTDSTSKESESSSEVEENSSKSESSSSSKVIESSSLVEESSSTISSDVPQNRFALLLDGVMPYAENLVNSKTLTGIHFKLSNGYEDTAHWRKAIYGLNAYCVEPGVNALGTSYTETEVSTEQYYKMSLADYWGRQWLGDTAETNFYVQLYVWEALGNTLLELSGPTVSYADYQAWCGKINAKIDAFFTPPSFANQSIRLKVGESITLTDTNNALSAYYLDNNSSNLDIVKNDYTNTLTLTAKADSNDGRVTFKYDIDPLYEMPMYYWNTNDGQDVVTMGIKDPTGFRINVQVDKTGILALKKTSEDGKVGGLEFNVKSVDGSFNQNLITAEDGTFTKELEIGDYDVEEVNVPDKYVTPQKQRITIKPSETTTVTFNNVLKKFNVKVTKVDKENTATQGNATLAGAVYGMYQDDTLLEQYTTDSSGTFTTSYFPTGSGYYIQEITPSVGYTLDTTKYVLEKTEAGNYTIELNGLSPLTAKEQIIRGGVTIAKWDNEIDSPKAQGGATLAGTVVEVYNRSKNAVLVDGVLYAPNTIVVTLTTDEKGLASTVANLLPYGDYEAIEKTSPIGYLPTGILKRSFSITEDGKIVELNTSSTAIKNNPIRGDIKGIKVSDGDMKRLANVPFKITSVTTGESHVVVTDENAIFDTSSSWNSHKSNTNRGETSLDGIWFGDESIVNDDVGALLYDTYLVEEQRCSSNEGYELIPAFPIRVYRNNVTVDLGTLTNDYIVPPQIGTQAKDNESGGNDAYVNKETSIVDTVEYSALTVGKTYTVKGVLMDKATNSPLLVDGKEITAETTFVADKTDGTVDVTFTFDSLALKGKEVVVFETLYVDNKEVAVHADIEDKGQTIKFFEPKIQTTAKDKVTGTNEADVSKQTTIVDTVSYSNLILGKSYTVKGVLMDKATNSPLLVDGKEVTASTTFVADKKDGTVDVLFTFDSSALKGKEVVVFESLYYSYREIATHADINDVGQTIKFNVPPTPPTPTPPSKVVKTGDDTNLLLPIALLVVGVIALGVFLWKNKKYKQSVALQEETADSETDKL